MVYIIKSPSKLEVLAVTHTPHIAADKALQALKNEKCDVIQVEIWENGKCENTKHFHKSCGTYQQIADAIHTRSAEHNIQDEVRDLVLALRSDIDVLESIALRGEKSYSYIASKIDATGRTIDRFKKRLLNNRDNFNLFS